MKEREKTLFEDSPVLEAIVRLAFPTVIGQIILVLYNMADTFFIGLTGSDAMITAATVCMPAFMFLQAISNLFGVGGASVISRALGARDLQRAKDTASFAFWGCAAVTVLYSLGAWLFAGPFVDLLGGSNPLVHDYAVEYLTFTVVIGGLATSLNALLAHLVRSEGRSLQASIGVALGGVMNIALDPLFMFVILPRGYETLGAAIATALSNVIALAYFLIVVLREGKRSILRLSPRRLDKSVRGKIPADVLMTGLPACLMTLCENISYAVLDALMAASGTALQAGLGVAKKVNMLAHSIVRGMSQGVLPLIGYNYAAGNHKRMKTSITLSMALSVAMAAVCMTVSLVFSRQLIGLFIPSGSESVTYGASFLCILCLGGPFSACAYALISFFQAVGKGMRSFVLAILRKGLLDIPLMFLLNRLLPIFGIVWATPITDVICCVISIGMFVVFLRQQEGLLEERAEAAEKPLHKQSVRLAHT
ncbi:MAG: MATE family efflux transporter [Clostridiales bacterium]|nr:MATE family efflux transporter [Clostridiales bacterium]